MNKEEREMAKNCSLIILSDECATLYDLLQNHDSLFYLQMLPYVSLYYDSIRDFFDINVESSVDSSMNKIRNNLKLFNERFGKISKTLEQEDITQNKFFENSIDKSLTKSLGLFFVDDKKIIGNTYLSNIELNMSKMEEDKRSSYAYSLGLATGQLLGTIYKAIKDKGFHLLDTVDIERKRDIKCCDINTNNNSIFNIKLSKEMNIYFLSILGKLNFVKYYLEPLFIKDDSWLFRVRYISIYYSHRAITKVLSRIRKVDNKIYNEFNNILNEDMFNAEFRNYMMHYNLIKGDKFIITKENYSETKAWFGLVEECFGKSYKEYFGELLQYGETIETSISKLFDWEEVTYDD